MTAHFINLYFAALVLFMACYIFAYGVCVFIEYPFRKQWSIFGLQLELDTCGTRTTLIELFMPCLLVVSATMIYCSYKAGGVFDGYSMVQTIVMAMGLAFGARDQHNRYSV